MTGVQRRSSGIYECRVQMPKDLARQPVPSALREALSDLVNPKTGCFKGEVTRSLRTTDQREAKRRGRKANVSIHDLIDRARRLLRDGQTSPASQPITDTEAEHIARSIHADWLSFDEEQREGDDRRDLTYEDERGGHLTPLQFGPGERGMEADAFKAYGDFLDEEADQLRTAYARRDTRVVEAEVAAFLRAQGRELPASPQDRRPILMKVLEHRVQAIEDLQARQAGKVVPTPTFSESDGAGPRLTEAFAQWKAGGGIKGARVPSPNSILEAEQAVRRFIELHGDLRLGSITKPRAREYRDAIAKLPTRLPKSLRDQPLPSILAKDLSSYPTRDAATVNKLLALLGGIVSHAAGEGLLDDLAGFANPFDKSIRYRRETRAGDSRVAFEAADLTALFASPVYAQGLRPAGGGGEAAFWFPLIGLLSGMRLEEIAGIRLFDMKVDDATKRWFFDVSPEGGRSLKTASSIRCVPLHPLLETIGLLRYRQARVRGGAAPTDRLWNEVVSATGRPASAAWSKWFGRYLGDTVGIEDDHKVFHSFRHSFKRMARDSGLEEALHDALTGHAGRGSAGRAYGRGYSLKPLIAAMDRIEVPAGTGLERLHWD
ncbi:site-specific integrase [Prosthecodimorpha hirschii]|uniref:site-specific integrase n=1 Tax=Prosthecodimorpha hirschii TaxID=665126 RepID=UPI00112A16E6|nr:site-specific integrase [Prosthecomicrobium hirschii]